MHMLANLEKSDNETHKNRCEKYRETEKKTSDARRRTTWWPGDMASEANSLIWLFFILRRAGRFDNLSFQHVFPINHSKNTLSIDGAVVT